MPTIRKLALVCCTVGLLACSEQDRTPPPPPALDPVTSPTSMATVVLTGAAEYGASVDIQGGLAPVSVRANDFTALFRAEVGVATEIPAGEVSVTTTLTLTATDALGNVSEPVTIDVVYEAPHPEGLILELSRDVITADEGEIIATVYTTNDELTDLAGFSVQLTLSGVAGVTAPDDVQTVITNSSGVARATFSGLTAAAVGATVTAVNGELSDERAFDVIAGRAASFASFTLNGGASDGVVAAGDDVSYSYALADAHGNATVGQVLVNVNSPGAVVLDDGVSGIGTLAGMTHAGSYTITKRIPSAGVVESLPLEVQIAAGQRVIDLTLTLTRMAVNSKVLALTVVRDLYGNVILAPAPSFTVEPQVATTDFYTVTAPGELQFSKSGVYKITATFDDGENDPASDFEYILVEDVPDLQPPVVAVDTINGFKVCPVSGLLTNDLADCASRTEPITVFRRGTPVVVTLKVRDNRALSEVSYKAFGSGTSVNDFTYVGAGQYTAGADLPVPFNFTVQNGWAGDVTIVGQAVDAAGNISNSARALMRVRLDVRAGDREVALLASGPVLSRARDAAVAPDGSVFVVNSDSVAPVIFQVSDFDQTVSVFRDFYPVRPSFIGFDGASNLYAVTDLDVVTGQDLWRIDQVTPSAALSTYDANDAQDELMGLALLPGAVPARGRFEATSALPDNACLGVQTGASAYYVLQVAAACPGSGICVGGALGAMTPAACVQASANAAAQATAVAAELLSARATTGLSAFYDNACKRTSPGASTVNCVVLVADEAGTTPGTLGAQPLTLVSTSGNWSVVSVGSGVDAGAMYSLEVNNDRVREIQVPPAAGSSELRTYDFSQFSSGLLVDVAAAVRRAESDDPALAPRLFLFATDDAGTSQILGYDSGRHSYWVVFSASVMFEHVAGANNNDYLRSPYGIVYVPKDAGGGGDCLLVANREGAGDFTLRGEVLALTDLDNRAGFATLEGGVPIVTGFDRIYGLTLDDTDADPTRWSLIVVDGSARTVARIGRSASSTDCF